MIIELNDKEAEVFIWLKGTKPMKLSDITEDTPDGHYVTM